MSEVRVAERLYEDLDQITSDRVLYDVLNVIDLLAAIPSMGSRDIPASIALEFGEGVRKIPVSPFDLITIYHEDLDSVDVVGLIHQRAAW